MCVRRILFGEAVTQPHVEPLVLLRYGSEVVLRPDQIVGSNGSRSAADTSGRSPTVPVWQPKAA